MNFQVERLRRLPQQPDETWQGGIVKLPMWVKEDVEEVPVRPWVTGWISLKTRLIHMSEPRKEQTDGFDVALQSLADFACDERLGGYRPGKVHVRDPALAEYLRGMLVDLGMEVETRDKLFVFEQVTADMAEHLSEHPLLPNALDVTGVTVESMRAFADAAARFYDAEPWEFLSSDDLIEIQSPFVEAELRCVTVLGAAGDTFGLGFLASREDFDHLFTDHGPEWLETGRHWSVLFGPITELPFGDVDLWEKHDLPVAGEEAYPEAICYIPRGKNRRPGPDVLAFFEGLLRALAETTEQEVDSGRWQKQVDTLKGPMEFTLALPVLLEPEEVSDRNGRVNTSACSPLAMERILIGMERALDEQQFDSEREMQAFLQKSFTGKLPQSLTPATPLERATDLVCRAYDAPGRKQVLLARQALDISPDCADAYLLLAERTSNLDKQLEYCTQAVRAAERVLGPGTLEAEAGNFWGIASTRPYMRARFELAQCLERMARLEEAAVHYRGLLHLNPGDNQGVRFNLWPCLLRLGRDEEVQGSLKEYKDDKGRCFWDYARALVAFRQKGDTAPARKYLQQAINNNEHAFAYLRNDKAPVAPPSPSNRQSSEEEGFICAGLLADAWNETPGALEWLEDMAQ